MKKKGFTFIQLVLALFILGLSLSPVVMITMQGNMNLRENILYLDALMTATTIISQAKQYSFIHENIAKTITLEPDSNKGFVVPEDLFSKTKTDIQLIFKEMDKNLIYIMVQIKYEAKDGKERTIKMESGVFPDVR